MATYGLKIVNPAGELVVSSEGSGLYCLGKMTIQGLFQPTGVATSPSPGRVSGYSRQTIASASRIVCAIDLPAGKRVSVQSPTNIGGGFWQIMAHCGDTPDADGFDTVEYAVDVWAFAQHTGLASAWGLALYNSAGALSYDFTAGVPLAARAYFDGVAASFTIPSLTRPVALGYTSSDETLQSFVGSNRWDVRRIKGGWQRSGTSLSKVTYTAQKYRYNSPITDPLPVEEGDTYNQPGFILEGAVLP